MAKREPSVKTLLLGKVRLDFRFFCNQNVLPQQYGYFKL